ncbi:MAG: hypothetical protein C0482_05180 [Gordonia sp.]|nr:hypothetical protein [Gordonia sp. (in: high G+C Gram-positive bacteria)]
MACLLAAFPFFLLFWRFLPELPGVQMESTFEPTIQQKQLVCCESQSPRVQAKFIRTQALLPKEAALISPS